MEERVVVVVVREFDTERDRDGAEAVDRSCEVGPSGKMALYTDLLGGPVSRVRNSPAFLVLVAETVRPHGEIVGIVRGCIKTVNCGKTTARSPAVTSEDEPAAENRLSSAANYTKVGYILGLRVSPYHRRLGIGVKLVRRMEEWFREEGAEYAYMATEKANEASVKLFTGRCGYSKFRTPSILVQPVFAHRLPTPRSAAVIRLSSVDAEILYRRRFSATEFFPSDIDAVLRNQLSVGTFLAVYTGNREAVVWEGVEAFLAAPPESWAVASVWDCGGVFRLELRGAGRVRRGLAWASRAADRALPWLRIPSVPDIFKPFGIYLLYGIGGEGSRATELVRVLCGRAHNMARAAGGRQAVVAEVASCEPLREGIPHWRKLSCDEDLWCAKRLGKGHSDPGDADADFGGDWTKSTPPSSIFVDPREF